MLANAALIIGAYLFGSLPFMLALGRAKGFDFTGEEDLHDALWHQAGRLWGLAGVFVDFAKGIIPVLIGFGFGLPLAVVATAGVAAVAGQMWPVFQKFDGEKGNSTGWAMVATLTLAYGAWPVLVMGVIPVALGFGIRTVPRFLVSDQTWNERLKLGGPPSLSLPLGMAVGFAATPLAAWLFHQSLEMVLPLLALFIIIIARRLTAGLAADLKAATNTRSILINRFLYDRSYL